MAASLPPHERAERRSNRLTIPKCLHCGSEKTDVFDRTDYWLYVRCSDCAFIWSMRKPSRAGS
jgi:hypothetical protein